MQTAIVPQITSKTYKILGRLLIKKHPVIADALLSTFNHNPLQRDISKIENYFTEYCRLQGIEKSEYTGPVYKSSKVDVIRIFIASMIHFYYPEIHFQPTEELNLRKDGFVTTLAKVTGQQIPHVSNKIREVVAWEKDYDDFKEKVTVVVEKLKALA